MVFDLIDGFAFGAHDIQDHIALVLSLVRACHGQLATRLTGPVLFLSFSRSSATTPPRDFFMLNDGMRESRRPELSRMLVRQFWDENGSIDKEPPVVICHGRFFLLMMIAFAVVFGSRSSLGAEPSKTESEVVATVQQFAQYRAQQDYQGVWRLTSERFRQGNGNDQQEFEKETRNNYEFHSSEVEINSIDISESTALIMVTVTYVYNASGQKFSTALEEWKFVYENGGWFFEEYKRLLDSFDSSDK
jgi:hypothetical protein